MEHNPYDVPFELKDQLWPFPNSNGDTHSQITTIPGQPCITLDDQSAVEDFLHRELSTERLDELHSMLFLVSNKHNISPLHHQAIKGRQIIIAERPDLHLIWYYDRIFIKPIPVCLMNHAFYKSFLARPERGSSFHLNACGYLRTYASLIVHESDFEIAKGAKLLPADLNWDSWCRFIKHIASMPDDQVGKRYEYGEIRLTRLNFYYKVFFYGWSYHEVYHQYVDYFARFMAPYLFVFGGVTVILSAIQTALTADQESVYQGAAYGFCTFCIVLTVSGLCFFPLLYLFFQLKEVSKFIAHHR